MHTERWMVACVLAGAVMGCQDDGGRAEGASSVGDPTGGLGSTTGLEDSSGGEESSGSEDDGSTSGGEERPTDIVVTQLVGRSSVESPYLRTVDNFNDNETITLGFDARRHGLDGASCDVYVAFARTEAEWADNPALADARGGEPQTVTLQGGIADNRFEIAAAGALSSDAGASLGVGYDVVLDCDRNGLLDAGDVIDGGHTAGLYRTHAATASGPLGVALIEHDGGSWLGQRIFHPAEIGDMGVLPLVVVTHGWSYDHTMYDYIGEHLASYGYVVMIHQANVQDGGPPRTLTAAQDCLTNTDHLLANQESIGGGVLGGHLDATRIMLTGHSTGGEAVPRAVTALREGSFSSMHFGYDDVRIVSSMAPVSWHARDVVDPGDVPYHQFVAAADDDVSGAPIPSYTQARSIYERAAGERALTYIHGAGHGDLLDCCGKAFLDTNAPDLIGRDETKLVASGYFLALAELYLRGNEAGREYFSRASRDYRPFGISPSTVITNEYDQHGDTLMLDDFETSPGGETDPISRSSVGTDVLYALPHGTEVLMRDNDGSFDWSGEQASNGMTHARHQGDDPHALVFDFTPEDTAFLEVAVPAEARDFSQIEAVSFRACQGTRHPETVALAGPLRFTVSLVDNSGALARIQLGDATAIPPPYARTGEGSGVGWGNEFVTVRLRATHFLGDNPDLDLSAVTAVRFDFGPDFGSPRGRIGLDDIALIE